ncbi:hypothetical protein JKF63_03742 [Porcisia hertigi]|uniref:RING-CH-type domain-containing protein n=1 Tax=Porcisia hertigi TaxID=2761500 RepID=A0A836L414_9TRYP|nr:hypothetical protein JKF63_03742 [Porcisia hertigi]
MEQDPPPVCRICQSDGDPIIRPCRCEGTMAYAHPYCLAEWIASHGELSCEVCGIAYTFQVAVKDAPPFASIESLQLAGKLLVTRPIRRLCEVLFTPLQVLVCCAVVPFASMLMWRSVSAHMILFYKVLDEAPFFFELFYMFGVLTTFVAVALLWAFEQFDVWAFLHEDCIVGLPPEAPMQVPDTPILDGAATSALNEAFTRCSAEPQGVARSRYLTVSEAQMSKDTTLELLRTKVRASRGTAQQPSSWSFEPVWISANILLVNMMGISAIVLGQFIMYTLKWIFHSIGALSSRLIPNVYPSLHPQAAMAVTSAVVPPYVRWITASVMGLMVLPLILRIAAWRSQNARARLSRTLFLCSLFTRSIASVLALFLVWVVVIPVVVYICLFPFFVEGDVAPLMGRRDAWQVLRTEHLLPLHCDGGTRTIASVAKPVVQPLNVARALFIVLPDVLRGERPPLFDTVTCGGAVSPTSAHPAPAPVAEFVWYSAGVLIRISTFSTWLTLFGTLHTTLMWLLAGVSVVVAPYLTFARDVAENDFFSAFLRLHGGGVWWTLLEVPLFVALYTASVGFGAFVTLHHLFPDASPKSLTYLSFYSPAKGDRHFYLLFCWFDNLMRLHVEVEWWLRRCFLHPNGPTAEMQQRGSQVLENTAYAVCLLCANVLIGAVVEWASQCVWFPILGVAVNVMGMFCRGGFFNDAFLQFRHNVHNWKMQAVMLCFYGASVDFTAAETCICRQLVKVRPSKMAQVLMQRASEEKEAMVLLMLLALDNSDRNSVVVCSRNTLHRLTTKTVQHVATYNRLSYAAILAVAVPLLVYSQWHLNYIGCIAADYITLPLWLQLLIRWTAGALALAIWVFLEGGILQTSLFHRCLEYAPQLIEGSLSLDAVHAVLLPLAIHNGLVRFAVAGLTFTYNGRLLFTLFQMGALFVLLALRCFPTLDEMHIDHVDRLARFEQRRVIMDWEPMRLGPPVARRDNFENDPEPPQNNNNVAEPLPNEPWLQHGPPQPPPAHVVGVATSFPRLAQLRARFARWVASQTANDVVLVAYPRPSPPAQVV